MARHVFEDLGYRRYEWKCNALNAPSRRAAMRFGFTFEGVFRQHMITKGRNRDTTWFSCWTGNGPARQSRFEAGWRLRILMRRAGRSAGWMDIRDDI